MTPPLAQAVEQACHAPCRPELGAPAPPIWSEVRRHDVLHVKVREGAWGATPEQVRAELARRTEGAVVVPVFAEVGPDEGYGHVALSRWFRVTTPDAVRIGAQLAAEPAVESVSHAPLPAPPPSDSEVTPDFRPDQTWLDAGDGLGMPEGSRWTGGAGAGIQVADVEYGWTEAHEDLAAAVGAFAWGQNTAQYAFHGTSVLGQLVGGDNGFGVTGGVPSATPLVISPYDVDGIYDLAAAIVGAGALLAPGDVLLIEQQAYCPDGVSYCPVEVDDVVFDAIAAVVAAGIVVVEPGANGAVDLDDPQWDGRFDRAEWDSGAILVGGGASPLSPYAPRSWYPSGSSFGARVDVQGWFDSIATTTNGDYNGYYADLYYPSRDPLRAYTSTFGGTSGASPMVACVAVAAQAVALVRWRHPWDPLELRAAMIATGTPQPETDEHPIGPLPDLRRLLRTYMR